MEQNAPEIYLINENGVEQKISAQKLRFEYQTGAKITIEVSKWDFKEIVMRGYYGDKEYEAAEKGVILNIRPGGCNLIRVTTELYENTKELIK